MKFVDAFDIPKSGAQLRGVQYVSECGTWRVTASELWHADKSATGPSEWLVWSMSRATGAAERRMPWARFVLAEQAASAAALLDMLTGSAVGRGLTSASTAVTRLRDGATDRLRSVGTLGIFATMRAVHRVAVVARDLASRQTRTEA